jgi:acyl-CoA synthetase (AMP-forming)/AMP-acid ligase II/acyl carrier protein
MDATKSSDGCEVDALVPLRLRRHALEQCHRQILAFIDEDVMVQQSWTFGELDRRARSIAAHLQRLDVAGQPVIIAYPSCLEFVAAFLGCLYAGAIVVPACLPRSHGIDERLSTILVDSGSRIVLTGHRYQSLIARQTASRSATLAVVVIATDELADASDAWMPVQWDAEQLALLQYTSGSTRAPSGVMITHGNLAANLRSLHETLRTSADSVGISWLPLFHDMGLVAGALEPLWVGYPTFLMAPATFVQSPLRWLRAFSKYRGTIGGGPNFAFQACVDAAKAHGMVGLDLSSWELAWNGAEPLRASTVQEFSAMFSPVGFRPESLTPAYGLAEATLAVTANNGTVRPFEVIVDDLDLRNGFVRECAESSRTKTLVSSGHPVRATEVRIVQPDTHSDSDPFTVGEIWVRSDSVGRGYWQKRDESAATFGARLNTGEGPFLRTGDLGFMHDGELFVTGRRKDVIVIRGVNYYPQDIEHTVESSHPALRRDAGAVFVTEDKDALRVVAVHELRRDSWRTIDAAEVFVAIRRAVAREHQLALNDIVLLKPFGLPKTSSGKVQRAGCRMALQDQSLPIVHQWSAPLTQVAPIDFTGEPLTQRGVLERQLVNWLQRECALTNLTWKTPLMDLGIDSLKGVELGNALSVAFNHSFSATLLIDHPTVEALADLIREDVLGVKPKPVIAPPMISMADSTLEEDIASLDQFDLDSMLEESIDAVLKSGGRA